MMRIPPYIKFIVLLLLTGNHESQAQYIPYYSFTQQLGTYSELTGGHILDTGIRIGNSRYKLMLPFDFNLDGVAYRDIYIGGRGYISFGTTDPGTGYWKIYQGGSDFRLVCGFDGDIGGVSQKSVLSYDTLGSAPNRTFIAQWKDMGAYPNNSALTANFQIRLSEGSDIATIVYGYCYMYSGNLSVQVGLRGLSSYSFFHRSSPGGDWTSTVNGGSSSSNIIYNGGKNPPNGLTYTFRPPICQPPAAPTNLVLTPSFTSISGTFTPGTPAANAYLVLRTEGNAYPDSLPANGTIYAQNTIMGNSRVVYNGSSVSFSNSSLQYHTEYRYTIFPYNNQNCIGAPRYNTVNPLSATTRTAGPRRYTWIPQSGLGSWAIASNWSPRRDTPHSMDTLVFDNGGTVTVEDVPSQNLAVLHISNRSQVRLVSTGTPTLTLQEKLQVDQDASLSLEKSRITLTYPTSGTQRTGTIDGTLTLSGRSIYNTRNAASIFNGQVVMKDSAVFIADNGTALFNGPLTLQDSAKYIADNGPTTLNGSLNLYDKSYFNYTGSNISVDVNNVVNVYGANASFANNNNSTNYNVRFGEKSEYIHHRDGGYIPRVTYDPKSTVVIKGVVQQAPGFTSNVPLGNFVWNCPDQAANITMEFGTVNGSFSIVNTGAYSFAQTGHITIGGDFYQMSGTVKFPTSVYRVIINGGMYLHGGMLDLSFQYYDYEDSDDKLALSGNFMQYPGHVLTSSPGNRAPVIRFSGSRKQTVYINGTITTAGINYKLKNPEGAILTGNIPIQSSNKNIIHSGRWSGSGSFTYEPGSTLEIVYSSSYNAKELEWPQTNGPSNLVVSLLGGRSNNHLTLPGTRRLSGNLSLGTGIIVLGDDSLTLDGTISFTTGTIDRMISTDGKGYLIRRVASSSAGQAIDFPIGNTSGQPKYAHARINVINNPAERHIGVRTTSSTHPEDPGGITRYWSITDNQEHTDFYYNGYFDCPISDITGNANLQLSRWNGTQWLPLQDERTTISGNMRFTISDTLLSSAGQQLNRSHFTGRAAVNQTYTWTGASDRDFQQAQNWSPYRNTPQPSDILQFNNGQTDTIENIPNQTISRFLVANNTSVVLKSIASGTRTLKLQTDYNAQTEELTIHHGSTLYITGSTGTIAMEFTGDSCSGSVSGRMELYGISGTSHNFKNLCTGCILTITESGIWTNGGSGNTSFQATDENNYRVQGIYEHKFTSASGNFPTAIWEDGSIFYFTKYTTAGPANNSTRPVNLHKLIYDCPDQSFQGTTGNSFNTITVRDSFIVHNTGSGILDFGRNFTVNVKHFIQTGGAVKIGTNTSGTRILNISGSFAQTGGTIYGHGDSTFPCIIRFNGTDGAQTASFYQKAPEGNITYQISNPAGVDLNLNNALTSDFQVNRGGGIHIATITDEPIRTSLRIRYAPATTLQYSATGNITANTAIFPDTDGPAHMTINIGNNNQIILPGSRQIPGTLNMQSGNLFAGPYTLEIGSSPTTTGNLYAPNSHIILTTGALKRWYGINGLPLSPLNPGASGNNTGVYPVYHQAAPRHASVYFATGTSLATGGSITLSLDNTSGMVTGLNIPDGTYTIQQRTAGSWKFTPGDGIAAPFASIGIRVSFGNMIQVTTPSSLRLTQSSTAPGTHVASSGTPPVYRTERNGLTLADLQAASFHIGAADTSVRNVFFSVRSGDWHDAATWNLGRAPGNGDWVYISNQDTVTVTANGEAYLLHTSPLSRLHVNNGTLHIDSAIRNKGYFSLTGGNVILGPSGGGNRTFQDSGTLEVVSGRLTINGNLTLLQSSFLQTGGEIIIDGNANGNMQQSVASGTPILNIATREIEATGGQIVIVDPHAGTSSSASQVYSLFFANTSRGYFDTGHTIILGDGQSITSGGSSLGFSLGMHTSAQNSIGNLTINGSPGGTNRKVTLNSSLNVNNRLLLKTPNAQFDMNAQQIYVGGDIYVHENADWVTLGTLYLGKHSINSSPNANNQPQTITSAGSISSTTGGNFHNLVIDNANGGASIIMGDVIISHTLTFTRGILTIPTGNVLQATNVNGGSQTAGWLHGKLRIPVTAGTNKSQRFPIGDHQSYAPITLSFGNVTTGGSATFSNTSGDHAAISGSAIMPTRSVNRVYHLDSIDIVGSDMQLLFSWQNPDMDPGAMPEHMIVNEYSNSSWKTQLQSTISNMSLRLLNSLYQEPAAFQIGEPAAKPAIWEQPVSQSVCAGSSTFFKAISHAGYTYHWQANNGSGWETLQNGRHYDGTATSELVVSAVVPTMDQNKYRCIITNARDTSISSTAVLQVTALAGPMNIALWTDAPVPVCADATVAVATTVQNSGVTPKLQWFISGRPIQAPQDTLRSDRLMDGDKIYCLVTDPAGCAPMTWSDTITISVAPADIPHVNISSENGLTICRNDTVRFTASAINGGASPSYQWMKNNQPVGINQPVYEDFNLQHNDVISCILKTDGHCVSRDSTESNYLRITVNEPVTPSVSIRKNNGDTLCTGVNASFTAQPVNGGTPSYQWLLNGQPAGSNSSSYSSNSFNDGDRLSLVLTTSLGCVTKTTDTSEAVQLTVRNAYQPEITVTFSPGDTVCTGTAITFNATTTYGGPSPTYQWRRNSSIVGSNTPTYTLSTPANNDVITCILTSNLSCATPNRDTSDPIRLTVRAMTQPNISISASPGTSVCDSTPVTFSATPTNGGNDPQYKWKKNGVDVGVHSSIYVDSVFATGDKITCELTSDYPCLTYTTRTSNTLTMSITPINYPSIVIRNSRNSDTLCIGESYNFNAVVTDNGSYYNRTYVWKRNGTIVGNNSDTYTPYGTVQHGDTITCELTSGGNCTPNPTVMSNTIIVTRLAMDTARSVITISPGSEVCPNTPVTFTVHPINGGSAPQVRWYWNTQGTIYTDTSWTYTPTNGDRIYCRVTSSQRCVTIPGNSNEIVLKVPSADLPIVSITTQPGNTVCAGTPVTLNASVDKRANPSYQWRKNGADIPGAISSTYTEPAPAHLDVFICTVTDSLPCMGNTTRGSTARIQVVQPVVPSVSISVQPGTSIVAREEAIFTASPVNGGTAPVYQWKRNGINTGHNNPVFRSNSLNNNDEIYVEMQSNQNCANPVTVESNRIRMAVAVSVGDIERTLGNVSIYPNPSNGSFMVEGSNIQETNEEPLMLQVRTLTGQVVYTTEIAVRSGGFSQQIHLPESIVNGIYLVWLQDGHRKLISRLHIDR